uniref:Coat protein n=1 Tax=Oxera neriifolia tymo-like virus TaxID=2933118 RepID=A0A9C7LLZ7_9VIRU|nr:putative coat protein [Oxera neriifolia tymo-like virus]CAI5384016.1 putative coat protein [Oxera neriifolia tymo-like virus]
MDVALTSLLPSIVAAVKDVLASKDPQDLPQPTAADSGSSVRMVDPPAPPSTHRLLSTQPSRSSSSITLPFQFSVFDITGTESKTFSLSLASSKAILNLTKPYRFAKLTKLEAVVFTLGPAMTYPQTIDLAWTPAFTTLTEGDFMNTYGSERIVIGGPVNLPSHSIVPANLQIMNPTLKDAISYSDTPRLNLRFWQTSTSTTPAICGTVIIRGTIDAQAPTNVPTPN